MTNRDKLKNMSNIALADWLMNTSTCKSCIYNNTRECVVDDIDTCIRGVYKWLSQSCEGSNNEQKECSNREPAVNDMPSEPTVNEFDTVNKPSHYDKNGMECIDFIKVIISDLMPYEAYCLGNVIKYLWRFKSKNGIIDLDKAIRYIEFLKDVQEKNEKN